MGMEGSAFGGVSKSTGIGEDTLGMINPVGGMFNEGQKGKTTTTKSDTSYGSTAGVRLGPQSAFEQMLGQDMESQYSGLRGMLLDDPNTAERVAATKEYQNFVEMMSGINKSGGMPSAEDMQRANSFADQLFAPQREALNQSFEFAQQDAAKLAARLNRPINDPIIQAKLQQERMRQSNMLSADRSAFVAQEARSQPFQRLGMQEQLFNAKSGLADLKAGIASQAMANRMQLLNLGNSLQNQERNWRFQTSDKFNYGNQSGTSTVHSGGGGILAGLSGVQAGMGSVAGIVGSVGQIAGTFMGGAGGMMGGAAGGMLGGGGNSQQGQQSPPPAPITQPMMGGYYPQAQAQPTYGLGGGEATRGGYYNPSSARRSRLSSSSGRW
jgi:hypothetical protein